MCFSRPFFIYLCTTSFFIYIWRFWCQKTITRAKKKKIVNEKERTLGVHWMPKCAAGHWASPFSVYSMKKKYNWLFCQKCFTSGLHPKEKRILLLTMNKKQLGRLFSGCHRYPSNMTALIASFSFQTLDMCQNTCWHMILNQLYL